MQVQDIITNKSLPTIDTNIFEIAENICDQDPFRKNPFLKNHFQSRPPSYPKRPTQNTQHSATKHQGIGGLPLIENHTTQIQVDRHNQGQSFSLKDIGKKARSIFKPSPLRWHLRNPQQHENYFRKGFRVRPPQELVRQLNQRRERNQSLDYIDSSQGTNIPWFRYSMQHKGSDWTKYLEIVHQITTMQ